MNQEKIGKFIAACRKEKGLTQASLAEMLGITDRAVSKWETGKSMPDASIMLDLCKLLSINVNELLTGEHITMENYKEIAETNLIEIRERAEKADKNLLKIEIYMGAIVVPVFAIMVTAGSFAAESGNIFWGLTLIITARIAIFAFAFVGLKIEHDAG